MKPKEKMEDNTSQESSKPKKKKKLDAMVEAMERRSDPVKLHKMATGYFEKFREQRNIPVNESEAQLPVQEKEVDTTDVATDTTRATAAVDTTTLSKRAANEPKRIKKPQESRDDNKEIEPASLDATHSKSEAMVYSIMYRDTISKGQQEGYFSIRRLMKRTGIGSDKTVSNALKGLQDKQSIALLEPDSRNPIGTLYMVFTPKQIFEKRRLKGIVINRFTKKIKGATVNTIVPTIVNKAENTTDATIVENTIATIVENTTVDQSTPYIYLNKNTKSSSNKNYDSKRDDDEIFQHKSFVVSQYRKYTGNNWEAGDEEAYEKLKDILPDVIEAAIIGTVLRSKSMVYSLKDCEGMIEEYQNDLQPGYLSYLRKQWQKRVGVEGESNKENNVEVNEVVLPNDSIFQEKWLRNYLSKISGAERPGIKRLAERFDYFMLTAGKKRDWVKNETATFIGLVRGEVNVALPQEAPSFESRVEEQEREERERLEREESERREEELKREIREGMSQLDDETVDKLIRGAEERYDRTYRGERETIINSIVYSIMFEIEEKKDTNWKGILERIIEGVGEGL